MLKKIVMGWMVFACALTAEAVEIDISRAELEVTREQDIRVDGVQAMDQVGWMLLRWDAEENVYRVADFGESDPGPGECPSMAGRWEVTDNANREPYPIEFDERGLFEDGLGGSGEWYQRECAVHWVYSEGGPGRGATYEGTMEEDGSVMGGDWRSGEDRGNWRAVRTRE